MTLAASSRRNFGLDAIRALAIAVVIFSHEARSVESLGVLGVELFFVLSGFLVGGIFYRSVVKNANVTMGHTVAFWKRRWWRTLPNYFLFLILFLALNLAMGDGVPPNFSRYFLFLQNLTTVPGFFGVSWSLAIEEWFYLLMPLLFFILRLVLRSASLAFAVTIGLLTVVPLVLRFASAGSFNSFRMEVPYRLDAMMMGVICAVVATEQGQLWRRLRWGILPGAALILWLAFVNRHASTLIPPLSPALTFTLFPIGCAMVLPAAAAWTKWDSTLGKAIEMTALLSYSLYLCHMLLLIPLERYVIPERHNLVSVAEKIVYLPLVFGVAYLFFRFFEVPMTALRGPDTSSGASAASSVPHTDFVIASESAENLADAAQ